MSVVSTGYMVVDLIETNDRFAASPGGTASNVANAMRSIGWSASVAGAVGDDPAGRFFQNALSDDGVDIAHLVSQPEWATPVIVQIEAMGDHRWSFTCPHCGRRFAKHRPPKPSQADVVVRESNAPRVYFFDRASRYTIELADRWRRSGSCVVFEPSGLGRPSLFKEAVDLSHIVKYSSSRSRDFEVGLSGARVLRVRTSGKDGASYCLVGAATWVDIPALPVEKIVDSAGAGDWTSAGLIDALARESDFERRLASSAQVRSALEAGMKLGAVSCSWKGFRPPSWPTPSLKTDVAPEFYCPELSRNEVGQSVHQMR